MAGDTRGWNGWRAARWTAAGGLLLAPLIMMQISDEWQWDSGSFVLAGVMIGGNLWLFEWAMRRSREAAYRAGAAVALAAALLLVWINLAVGIVGDEGNPANLGFFCLVLAAAIGTFATEGRPQGMARTMLGVAAMQALLGLALATGRTNPQPIATLALTGGFIALWLLAAALFRKAAHDHERQRPCSTERAELANS